MKVSFSTVFIQSSFVCIFYFYFSLRTPHQTQTNHPLRASFIQYQAMNEDAKDYQPGFQYQDFIKLESTKFQGSSTSSSLPGSSGTSSQAHASHQQRRYFKFEPHPSDELESAGGNRHSDCALIFTLKSGHRETFNAFLAFLTPAAFLPDF